MPATRSPRSDAPLTSPLAAATASEGGVRVGVCVCVTRKQRGGRKEGHEGSNGWRASGCGGWRGEG